MSTRQLRSVFNKCLQDVLSPLGYRKRGDTFVRRLEDVSHVIGVQSSSSSTADCVKVTLNLGVYSHIVAERDGASKSVSTTYHCHWVERIGRRLPEKRDTWWTFTDEATASSTGRLVAGLLVEYGVPALNAIPSTETLKELWMSGRSEGPTMYRRREYLALLGED